MALAVPLLLHGSFLFANQLQNDSLVQLRADRSTGVQEGKMKEKRFCILGVLLMLMAIFAAPQLFAQSQT
jgi:hypothetical protein